MTVGPTNTVNDVCSPDFFQSYENLNKTLLQYYVSLHHVTVFFDGCPPHIPNFPSKRKWRCGDDVYYFEEAYKEDHLVKEYPLLNQCKRTLLLPSAAPLDHYDDSDDGAGVLEQSLRDGFGLYYGEPPYCTRCSQSDGSCRSDGYDEDVVSCHYYCSDKDCYAPKSNGMPSIFSILTQSHSYSHPQFFHSSTTHLPINTSFFIFLKTFLFFNESSSFFYNYLYPSSHAFFPHQLP